MAPRVARRRSTLRLARGVTADPGVLGGKPVVEGTRVPVALVVGSLAAGDSVEAVCHAYRLTVSQVRAALAYAAASVDEDVPLPSR